MSTTMVNTLDAPAPPPPPSSPSNGIVSVQPTGLQPSSTIHCSQVAGPSGLQGRVGNDPRLAASGVATLARVPALVSGTVSDDDSNVIAGGAQGRGDSIHVIPTTPASILTKHVVGACRPATNGVTTPRLDSKTSRCTLGTTATRDTPDILHRRVLETGHQHNVDGDGFAALGGSRTPSIHLSQPVPSSAAHRGLDAVSSSQPVASTEIYFSPLRTRSQKRTRNFWKL